MAYVSTNVIHATKTEQIFVLIQEFSGENLFNEC